MGSVGPLVCREYVELPVGEGLDRMLGAGMYLAVLAHPDNIADRDAFWKAARAALVREYVQSGRAPASFEAAEWIKRSRPRDVNRTLDAATRLIVRERLPASGIAMDVYIRDTSAQTWLRLQPTRAGRAVTSPRSGFAGLAAQMRIARWKPGGADQEQDYADNFRKRGWKRSRAVLHLGAGLHSALMEHFPDRRAPGVFPSVTDLILAPGWLPRAVQSAELLRLAFASRFKVPLGETIAVVAAQK